MSISEFVNSLGYDEIKRIFAKGEALAYRFAIAVKERMPEFESWEIEDIAIGANRTAVVYVFTKEYEKCLLAKSS